MTVDPSPLVDSVGRAHTNLRISVTDRCNIRCFYCMPEHVRFRPREELLTFEEIVKFVRIVVKLGINKLRITGGEPLVRSELPTLIRKLASIPGIRDLALTTNGILLTKQAEALYRAGLGRLNISLDTLREEAFQEISRREGLDRVLAGIAAAQRFAFKKIRLNAVAIRGLSEPDVLPLARFAREHRLELRFIEFMPLDGDKCWEAADVLDGRTLRNMLEAEFGQLIPVPRSNPSQPAADFQYADGLGRVGFINSVTEPFCSACNRLRLTAEGQLRNCLFSTVDWDARDLLRSGGTDGEIAQLVRDCVGAKAAAHGIGTSTFQRPERAMYQIGG
jgi:cyclic pyranopterin phosphate synthase